MGPYWHKNGFIIPGWLVKIVVHTTKTNIQTKTNILQRSQSKKQTKKPPIRNSQNILGTKKHPSRHPTECTIWGIAKMTTSAGKFGSIMINQTVFSPWIWMTIALNWHHNLLITTKPLVLRLLLMTFLSITKQANEIRNTENTAETLLSIIQVVICITALMSSNWSTRAWATQVKLACKKHEDFLCNEPLLIERMKSWVSPLSYQQFVNKWQGTHKGRQKQIQTKV